VNELGESTADAPASAVVATPAMSREQNKPSGRFDLRRAIRHFNPASKLWYYSSKAYHAGWHPVAFLLKTINFFVFHNALCYECDLAGEVEMRHFGMGCVVHPNVTIGRGVKMFHHVSLAAETRIGSSSRIVIEDDVTIGAHAIILGNDHGGIRIGKGAVIGAGSIVTRDVAPGATIVPLPSRPVKGNSEGYKW